MNRSKRLAERLTAQVTKARFLVTLRNPPDVELAHPFRVRLTVRAWSMAGFLLCILSGSRQVGSTRLPELSKSSSLPGSAGDSPF